MAITFCRKEGSIKNLSTSAKMEITKKLIKIYYDGKSSITKGGNLPESHSWPCEPDPSEWNEPGVMNRKLSILKKKKKNTYYGVD